MTKVQWDLAGHRRYETGIDRGVLYLPDGGAVPWNGLTSVTEDGTDYAVEEYYLDGVKYLNRRIPGDYAGTLKAITYPDKFAEFDGLGEMDNGVFATGQPVKRTFGLSYRTLLGNDQSGQSYGYKIHLLYNLTAKPDTRTFASVAATATIEDFSWILSGVPISIPNMRPAVHLVLNSTKIDPAFMQMIENYLYGTDTQTPALPDAITLSGFQTDGIYDPIIEPL